MTEVKIWWDLATYINVTPGHPCFMSTIDRRQPPAEKYGFWGAECILSGGLGIVGFTKKKKRIGKEGRERHGVFLDHVPIAVLSGCGACCSPYKVFFFFWTS